MEFTGTDWKSQKKKNKKRAGGIRRENMPNVFFVQWRAVHQVGLI